MIDEKVLKTVEEILKKGHRVELIPVKDGVRVIKIEHREVKG